MDKETIKRIINNSTWNSPEKKNIYRFANGNILSINDENHSNYSINSYNNKIKLKLGPEKIYYIEYVNDFMLKLSDSKESFRIIPE